MVFLYWNISIVLSFCCVFLTAADETGMLPAPVNPVLSWTREFCPTLSWTKPNISDTCVVNYTISKQRGSEKVGSKTLNTYLLYPCQSLEEDLSFTITTVPHKNCPGRTESKPVHLLVRRSREVAKDFSCAYYASQSLNCSWAPIPHLTHLRSFYSFSDGPNITELLPCPVDLYERSQLIGCHLDSRLVSPLRSVYFLIRGSHGNTTVSSTFHKHVGNSFRPVPPEVSISLGKSPGGLGEQLEISWSPPPYAPSQLHCFRYELHYNACGEHKAENHTQVQASVSYNPKCQYSVWVQTHVSDCGTGQSQPSQVKTYGEDSASDVVLTVVIIAVSVFVSLCALLVCFFYKYKEKLLPKIPEPNLDRSIKGLMERLYVPVREDVEGNLEVCVCPDTRLATLTTTPDPSVTPDLTLTSDLDLDTHAHTNTTHTGSNTHIDSNTQTANSTHTDSHGNNTLTGSNTCTHDDTHTRDVTHTGDDTHKSDVTLTGDDMYTGDDCAVVLDYSSVTRP